MKLKILNKNRINNSLPYNLNNLKYWEVDSGFSFSKNFNQTLNNIHLTITHTKDNIDIEPLDEVLLYDDTRFNDIYMCVENYTKKQELLDFGEITYTYEIALLSQIKRLEGILLPNLSITPFRENKRSVGFYLRQYLNEYGEKIRCRIPMELIPDEYEEVFKLAYNFSDRLLNRFDLIDCPELQWNEPTLREVIDDLLMVDNCIATLNNGVIDYLDLESLGNPITNYNYIQESQAIDDYVSEIKMTMQNGLQNDIENVKNVVSTTEHLHYVANENETIHTDNFLFKTQMPILNIKHLYCRLPITDDSHTTKWCEVDLCDPELNLIVEYSEYITRTALGKYENHRYYEAQNYQNTTLYFNRGDNKILGFNDLTNTYLWYKKSAYEFLLDNIADYLWDKGEIIVVGDFSNITDNDPSSITFKIEYETIANQVFSASKTDYPNNYRQIKDNQTNSWVNVNTQGKLEYSKANRLGNKSLLINSIYKNTGNLIDIQDTYNDNYIIYQVNYVVFKDYVNVNALACKNYVLKDYFTGINSKIRTWVNAQNEAFKKCVLAKYYLEISDRKITEYGFDGNIQINRLETNTNPSNYFLSPIKYVLPTNNYEKYDSEISEALVKIKEGNTELTTNYSFTREVNTKIVDKSILFTIELDNNAYLSYISNFDEMTEAIDVSWNKVDDVNVGGAWQQVIKYVDDNYEFNNVEISYLNGSKMTEYQQTNLTGQILTNQFSEILQLPLVYDNQNYMESANAPVDYTHPYMKLKLKYQNRKDNKEILSYALQLEFSSENRNMYLTPYFVQYQEAVNRVKYKYQETKVYLGSYDYGRTELSGSDTLDSGATINIASDGKVEITLSQPRDNQALLLVKNNKILVGLKEASSFYLNTLKEKRKSVYNSNRVKIGEL